jgi:hypothetical protein
MQGVENNQPALGKSVEPLSGKMADSSGGKMGLGTGALRPLASFHGWNIITEKHA